MSPGAQEPPNPYAPPEHDPGPPMSSVRNPRRAALATRLRHLDDEAMVRSVALLLRLLTRGLPVLGFVVGMVLQRRGGRAREIAPALVGFVLLTAGVGLLATGLSRLRRWARIGTATLAALATAGLAAVVAGRWGHGGTFAPTGLFLVPLALVLYILLSRDGAAVFSNDYRSAVEATPRIRPRTSLLVPLAFLMTGFLAAVLNLW